jgi:hypothetical protein
LSSTAPAAAIIDVATRQSYLWQQRLTKLSSTKLAAEAIIDSTDCQSYHQCFIPPKLSLTPQFTTVIIEKATHHMYRTYIYMLDFYATPAEAFDDANQATICDTAR